MLSYSLSQGLHRQCGSPCFLVERQPTCQCPCNCLPAGRPVFSTARRRDLQIQWVQGRKYRACCGRRAAAVHALGDRVDDGSVSVVLLAGGVGKRMGAAMPKQYLPLQGQPIALYSLDVFAAMREVGELVVVCDPSYDGMFREHYAHSPARRPPLLFARPGAERQDSVSNGFAAIRPDASLVAIHDSARPLVQADDVRKCMADALQVGAAVLGVRVKATIKEVRADGLVVRTLERASLWEVQTPQVIRPELLRAGFELVRREHLEVTDDVSIIEALGSPVRLTAGSYSNIKVTTPDDLVVAEGLLKDSRGAPAVALAAAA